MGLHHTQTDQDQTNDMRSTQSPQKIVFNPVRYSPAQKKILSFSVMSVHTRQTGADTRAGQVFNESVFK